MKKVTEDIQLFLLLLLLGTGMFSCTDEVPEAENAYITFTAMLQDGTNGRTVTEEETLLSVDTLVVGIFGTDTMEIDRQGFVVTSSEVNVQLTLPKGQVYHLVFWAYNKTCRLYDVTNLKGIVMNGTNISTSFEQMKEADAFFALRDSLEVNENRMERITLVRPLAQVNVGTSGEPVPASLVVNDVPTVFHPFTKQVSGEADMTWGFGETTTDTLMVDGQTYACLARGYVFAPFDAPMQKDCILVLGQTQDINFSMVKLQANHRTRIVGSFTGAAEE